MPGVRANDDQVWVLSFSGQFAEVHWLPAFLVAHLGSAAHAHIERLACVSRG